MFWRWFITLCLGGLLSVETSGQNIPDGRDSARVDALNKLADQLLVSNPKKAEVFTLEALELSRSLAYRKGEIIALNRLGENQFRQSNYAMAVEYTTQSLQRAEAINDSSGMGMAYRVLGNIHTFGFKQFDKALEYQLKAFAIYDKLNDVRNIASFCGNITWIYANTGQHLEEGHRLADRGIRLADSLMDTQMLSYNYNSKGLLYQRQSKYDSALYFLDKSIETGRHHDDLAVIAYNKSLKGDIYVALGETRMALQQYNEALKESRSINLREVMKNTYAGLSTVHERLGNTNEALYYYKTYTALKDSLVNWETTQKALITQLSFDQQKREAKILELELLNQQNQREQLLYSVTFGIGFVLLITVTGLVLRNNRQRKESNTLLQKKNEEIAHQNVQLKQANELKDKFFSIIGHDLRSPLVSLKSLLAMLVRNEISEEEFRAFTPKLNHLVVGTNETLENLFQWSHAQLNGWTFQPVHVSYRSLAEKTIPLFAETARSKQIAIENELKDDTTVLVDRNHAELILRNLIHNAIKFTPEGGKIWLRSFPKGDFQVLQVTDTGLGMHKEHLATLFTRTAPQTSRGTLGERGTGLGLMLCHEMIQYNHGRIEVESSPGKGTTFSILLPRSI
jgi:signal transduction histidine kinase